jgi:hypothetical protein
LGYGSNLCEERFLSYINGGEFRWGGSRSNGCTDKTPPEASKPLRIPHNLYFAASSTYWQNGGIAFVSLKEEPEKINWTLGRMWKIKREQYREIKIQEGIWYKHELLLGDKDGIPILTLTHKENLTTYHKPSAGYLMTMVSGIREIHTLPDEGIVQYLIGKPGVEGNYDKAELLKTIESAIPSG